jgi:DNA-binding response OmpR family regulator
MGCECPPRILVVDDDPGCRLLLQATVRALGFTVETAENGLEALRLVGEQCPDALLLDVSMPGMDGLEVCRRLRAEPRTAAVPILLVTGSEELSARVAGFEAGADDYVPKPFDPAELAIRLKGRLELAATRARVGQLQGVLATIRLISHEFNNPLQAVIGGVDLLHMAREGKFDNEAEALAMLTEGAEQLVAVAARLRAVAGPVFKDSPIGPMLDMDACAHRPVS